MKNTKEFHFPFEEVLNKRGRYFISQKSLEEIYNSFRGVLLERFLKEKNLMIVRLNDNELNLSVIKKSIL